MYTYECLCYRPYLSFGNLSLSEVNTIQIYMNENHETWLRRPGGKEVWTTRRGLSDDNKSRTNSSCPVLKLSFISLFLWFPWSHLYFEEKKKIIVSTPSFSHSHQYNWEPNFIVVVPISCAQRSNWSILRYETAKKVTRLPSYETWARSLFLVRKNIGL